MDEPQSRLQTSVSFLRNVVLIRILKKHDMLSKLLIENARLECDLWLMD
jgi:hypothetical protein